MAVKVETRKVDSKGRVQEALVGLYGKSVIEEYLSLLGELGEASVEEVEKASREKVWKSLREH